MKPVSSMVIPPKAVSRLFDACANAAEGDDCPSLFDFGANLTIGTGIKYLNWVARAENSGGLSNLPGGSEARNKERQEEYDRYIVQLWLSRMSEEYQRSYRELMTTLNEARDYYAGAKEDVAECIKTAQKEMETLRPHAVTMNGTTFWIGPDGELIDDDGRLLDKSNTKKEDLEKVWRQYRADPERARKSTLGGEWVDYLKKAKGLENKIVAADADAAASQEAAKKGGMSGAELKNKNDETAATKEEIEEQRRKLTQNRPNSDNDYINKQLQSPDPERKLSLAEMADLAGPFEKAVNGTKNAVVFVTDNVSYTPSPDNTKMPNIIPQ